MKKEKAQKTMQDIAAVYDQVAIPFIASRKKDWEEFQVLSRFIKPESIILDAGCAHGRLVPYLQDIGVTPNQYTGIDISERLIHHAKEAYPNFRFETGNVTALPYQDNYFDVAISSAVLHHIPSEALRIQTLKESYRVTKPGGYIIYYVWNAFYFKHLWKHIVWSYIKHFVTLGTHEARDMSLPFFGKHNRRYVHAFTKKELQNLCKKSGCVLHELRSYKKNFCLIIQKQ